MSVLHQGVMSAEQSSLPTRLIFMLHSMFMVPSTPSRPKTPPSQILKIRSKPVWHFSCHVVQKPFLILLMCVCVSIYSLTRHYKCPFTARTCHPTRLSAPSRSGPPSPSLSVPHYMTISLPTTSCSHLITTRPEATTSDAVRMCDRSLPTYATSAFLPPR